MRVVCINENWNKPYEYASPVFMGEYEITGVRTIPQGICVDGMGVAPGVYYKLVGFGTYLFHSDYFATLPAADADQMNEEVRESITNLETVLV